jgi:hypothetical protein
MQIITATFTVSVEFLKGWMRDIVDRGRGYDRDRACESVEEDWELL